MSTDTGLELGARTLDTSVEAFAVENSGYYSRAFAAIQDATGLVFSWNSAAALLGPLWAALRGVWGSKARCGIRARAG